MNTQQRVYLSLGANEKEPLASLKTALQRLAAQPQIDEMRVSHFYRTEPVGIDTDVWFINAACSFLTTLTLTELAAVTTGIERELGKDLTQRKAVRPIDIDILFYGARVGREAGITVPHPRWKERLFVLVPLLDLTEEIVVGNGEGKERYCFSEMIVDVSRQQALYIIEKNIANQYDRDFQKREKA